MYNWKNKMFSMFSIWLTILRNIYYASNSKHCLNKSKIGSSVLQVIFQKLWFPIFKLIGEKFAIK